MCKTDPDQIWMAWSGLGQMHLVWKQAGVQESPGPVSGRMSPACYRFPTFRFSCVLPQVSRIVLRKTNPDPIGFWPTVSGLGRSLGSGWLCQVWAIRIRSGSKLVCKKHQPASAPIRIGYESDLTCLLGSCCAHSSGSYIAPQELASLQSSNLILSQQLERTQGDLTAQRSRLQEVQQQHMELLEAARQSGHDALTVVVEQYKVSAPSPPPPPPQPSRGEDVSAHLTIGFWKLQSCRLSLCWLNKYWNCFKGSVRNTSGRHRVGAYIYIYIQASLSTYTSWTALHWCNTTTHSTTKQLQSLWQNLNSTHW